MEPRSFDRGKCQKPMERGGNVSASMEPRSFDRGKEPATRKANPLAGLLQWSRDRLIAERTAEVEINGGGVKLQWSRDRLIAESPFRSLCHVQKPMLQWSRDRLIAESFRHRKQRAPL